MKSAARCAWLAAVKIARRRDHHAEEPPKVDDLELLFLMGTEFLIAALEGFAAILKLDLGAFCEESKRAVKALADAHRS